MQQDSRCCRLFGSTRQFWSECAVLLSQGLSQSAAGWRLSPPLTLWTVALHVSSFGTDVFLVPGCSCHWSGEEKRLCAGAVKPPGPPGGAEPFVYSVLNVSPASPWCTTLFCVTTQNRQSDGSVTLGYRAFQVSCCCDGAAVNSCVVCLCLGGGDATSLNNYAPLEGTAGSTNHRIDVAEPLYVLFFNIFFFFSNSKNILWHFHFSHFYIFCVVYWHIAAPCQKGKKKIGNFIRALDVYNL